MDQTEIRYRNSILHDDIPIILGIIHSVALFSPEEKKVAIELAQESLLKGAQSSYHFLFAEDCREVLGYACFGYIPCTIDRFDIYWLVVHKKFQGLGIGKRLLKNTESEIAKMAGNRIYIETSSRDAYKAARIFYSHCGYREEAILKDFYAPGDDKIIYVKQINSPVLKYSEKL